MSKPVKLRTTQQQFESLHEVVDKARQGTKLIVVSRDALVNLLMDHSNFAKLIPHEVEKE